MKRSNTYRPSFGSIISGTLKNADLLDAFTDEAERRSIKSVSVTMGRKILDVANHLSDDVIAESIYEDDSVSEIVLELADLLNENLPPYWYFGLANEDGSDFGYWFNYDQLNDDSHYGTVIVVDDHGEIEKKYGKWKNLPEDCEYVAIVSDHGNVNGLYNRYGRLIW